MTKITPHQLRSTAHAAFEYMDRDRVGADVAKTLRDAADLIEELQTQLDAVGAGGVEPLRKSAPAAPSYRALREGLDIELTVGHQGAVKKILLSKFMLAQAKNANDIVGAHVMAAVAEIGDNHA